jgi:hypothetical protein
MLDTRQRRVSEVGGVMPSVLLSLLASAAATYLLRQLLSTATRATKEGQEGESGGRPAGNVNVPVVIITIVARNRWAIGRRGGPPPYFLPFLLARVIRAKRRARSRPGWQRLLQ